MTSELKGLSRKQMSDFMEIKGALNLKKAYEKQGGAGFFEDVARGIADTGMKVNDFLKKTKIISKGSKLAKYILPGLATVLGPEVLAGIPLAEKAGQVAGDLGYGCMKGDGYTVGLTQLGNGSNSVLTISQNGTYQMTAPTHIQDSGIGILANNRVDAGAPSLSGIQSGLGMGGKTHLGEFGAIFGSGLGAFGVIASQSNGIKI